jgi:hemoglobin
METTTTTLYDRIGGAPAVEAAVRGMYDRILADPELAPFFARTNFEHLVRRQCAFIGAALGGPEVYTGRDMAAAHRRHAIADHHFDLVAGHLMSTLESLGVASDLSAAVLAIVDSVRPQVVNSPSVATLA